MKRSDINSMPEYYERYINLVDDIEIMQAFNESIDELQKLNSLDEIDNNLLSEIDAKFSTAGKWTAKEHLQHVTDFERIMCYRTMLFARREGSIPQSIDQDKLSANMGVSKRSFGQIVDELKSVRLATKALFASFDDENLQTTGINWKYELSVLAMGFSMLGHQIHHLKFVEENYYPALKK